MPNFLLNKHKYEEVPIQLGMYSAKEAMVWAVVFNTIVIDHYIGPPDNFKSILDEMGYDISLVQLSQDRGRGKIGSTWTGERFIVQ